MAPDFDKLFAGIDHTAIVVGDTEESLRFYRDLLGMRIVGVSENYGTEQEHLNNVFGAHLRSHRCGLAPGPASNCLSIFRLATAVRFHWTSMPTM